MNKINKMLLMSIKPEYMQKILTGNKTIELRRTRPKVAEGDLIIFYASSPRKAILGAATVISVVAGAPSSIWRKYKREVGITKAVYDSYYSYCNKAYGIILDSVWAYDSPISLEKIRELWDGFVPPQSYRYLSKDEYLLVSSLNKI